jgi:hypothetical protein
MGGRGESNLDLEVVSGAPAHLARSAIPRGLDQNNPQPVFS